MNLTKDEAQAVLRWAMVADHESMFAKGDIAILVKLEEAFPGILKDAFIDLEILTRSLNDNI